MLKYHDVEVLSYDVNVSSYMNIIYIRHPRRSILLRYIVHTLFAFVSIFFNKVFRVLSLLAKDMYGNLEKRGQWWFLFALKKKQNVGCWIIQILILIEMTYYIVIIFLKLNDFVMILFDDKKKYNGRGVPLSVN